MKKSFIFADGFRIVDRKTAQKVFTRGDTVRVGYMSPMAELTAAGMEFVDILTVPNADLVDPSWNKAKQFGFLVRQYTENCKPPNILTYFAVKEV